MRWRCLAPLLAASVLAGCALGPRPEAPVVAPPAAGWNGQADAAEWPAADWWKVFGSPELDQLIATAQAHNDDLAAGQAMLRQADAQARIAGAALLPTVGLASLTEDTRKISPTGQIRRYGTLNGVFSASYEVDVWGKNHDAHSSAIATAQAASYQLAVIRTTIVASVASTYFNLLATQDNIASLHQQLADGQAILNGLIRQQRQGLVTGLQVAQQQALVEQVAASLPPLEAQRAHLVDALALLTGHNPEGFSVKGGSLASLALPPVTAGVPSALLVHRPDVQAAERALAAAGANISVARKAFLPSFGLTGSGGVGSVALASAMAGPASVFDMGLNVLQPIFDGGRLHGQLEAVNGRYQELAADYLKAVHQAYGDVEDALVTEQGARHQFDREANAVQSARQALAMARAGYGAGTTDMLPVLAAQQALALADTQQIQANLGRAQGLVDLYKALGCGWTLPS
ncbi:MAG: efflux transporter outer membrane subunit [Sphingomonadales bacterium]|nr:efflux transporter outer membrane subunit [Sphingomonadales bacterium]MDE2168509.1 efflux transporter outer membrane subunit [Sphingomonadales bacterium]